MSALKEVRSEGEHLRAVFTGALDAAWVGDALGDFERVWAACRQADTRRLLGAWSA